MEIENPNGEDYRSRPQLLHFRHRYFYGENDFSHEFCLQKVTYSILTLSGYFGAAHTGYDANAAAGAAIGCVGAAGAVAVLQPDL
jgi:hypothetical protein